MIGPRNSVVADILGEPYDLLMDTSPWVVIDRLSWPFIRDDYPEFWVNKIHDYVWSEDGPEDSA